MKRAKKWMGGCLWWNERGSTLQHRSIRDKFMYFSADVVATAADYPDALSRPVTFEIVYDSDPGMPTIWKKV